MTHHPMENPRQPASRVGEYGHEGDSRQDGFNWEDTLLHLITEEQNLASNVLKGAVKEFYWFLGSGKMRSRWISLIWDTSLLTQRLQTPLYAQTAAKTWFLGVAMRMFQEELWINTLGKEDPSYPVWVHIIQFVEGPNGTKRQRLHSFSLLDLGYLSLPALGHQSSWFLALQTGTELYHWLPWFSSLQMVNCETSQPP